MATPFPYMAAPKKSGKAPAVHTESKVEKFDPLTYFRRESIKAGVDTYGESRANAVCDASVLDLDFQHLVVPDLFHQWGLGRIGYVLGRIKLIAGMEGASKSSSLYYDCNLAISQGGLASIVALEEADSSSHIENYVDPTKVMIWKAETLEEGMEMSLKIQKIYYDIDQRMGLKNPIPKVQGFDSIAGATEAAMAIDFDEDVEEQEQDQSHSRVGGIAKTMKSFFNTMKTGIVQTGTLWVALNQAREQIYTGMEAQFMMRKALRDRLALTGGRAQRFAASYLEFHQKGRTSKEVSEGDEDVKLSTGFDVTIDWIKNKTGIPDRKITRKVAFGRSFDYSSHTIPFLSASRICGMSVNKKRYWCDEVGVDENHKVEDHIMYEIVHRPEHMWKFQKELGIRGVDYPEAPVTLGASLVPGPSSESDA